MARILITGAAGSIGKELSMRLINEGHTICAFDCNEDSLFRLRMDLRQKNNELQKYIRYFLGDVRDKNRLNFALRGVDIVFHCAALKHVTFCEYNPTEAVATNILGSQNVIESSITNGVKKVIITSSDKAVNPSSVMGASKLVSERLFISANSLVGNQLTRFSCVRFGNVWNTNGSVGKIFKNQIEKKINLTITDKRMTRFFVTMEDAISLCINSSIIMKGGETFVLDMGVANIFEIAKKFSQLNNNISINEIGINPGEKLYEELYTEVEGKRTIFKDGLYVILPEINDINNCFSEVLECYKNEKIVGNALRSDSKKVKKADIDLLVKDILKN